MDIDWDSLKIVGDNLMWISGVIVALVAAIPAYRYLYKKVSGILFKYIIFPVETVIRMGGMVETIEKELKPNGGSSLRDALNRVESYTKTNAEFSKFILSNMEDGFFEADSLGKCIWVSKTWVTMTGVSFSEAQGNGWINGVVPEDRQKVKDEWFAAIKDKREFNLHYKINSENPVSVHGVTQFLRGADKRIMSIVGSIKKID